MLLTHITEIHQQSRKTYGWPRVHAKLALGLGWTVNPKRVTPLRREADPQGLIPAPNPPRGRPAPRPRTTWCTTKVAPDRLWLTDITEHPTNEGKL